MSYDACPHCGQSWATHGTACRPLYYRGDGLPMYVAPPASAPETSDPEPCEACTAPPDRSPGWPHTCTPPATAGELTRDIIDRLHEDALQNAELPPLTHLQRTSELEIEACQEMTALRARADAAEAHAKELYEESLDAAKQYKQEIDAAEARVRELERIIEEAPHESFCTLPSASKLAQCGCWTPAPAKVKP